MTPQTTMAEIKQLGVFRDFFKSEKKFNVLIGGAGSGKSYAAADDVILRTIQPYKTRYIVARKVAKTMRASVFDLLINRIAAMGLSSIFVVNKTEMSFKCKNGNDIILVGLDDVNKLKSIYDPTDSWIEEADQTTQADLEEIERRIRTVTGRPAKITLTLNPTSAFSWIKSYFFDSPDTANVYTLKTTYRDNPLLDPSYHEAMERLRERNPSAYRVYGLGEWGVVEGVVFEQWDIADIPDGARFMGYGLDFGYTNDPTTLIGCWTLGDHLYLDESLYRTGLTNPDISAMFSALGVKKSDEIIADSAEPKSIEELHRMGWFIKPAVKGPDSIRSGIDALKRYVIHLTPRSSNLQREFSSYTWSQDKDGKWRQEPIDMFNHGIDAARYRVAFGGRKAQPYKGKVPRMLVGG